MNIIVKSIYAVVITALILLTPSCASEPGDDSEGAAEINVETTYLETIEQSLQKAGQEDLTPLNEHPDSFREKRGKVFRDIDLDYEKFGVAPRINLINYIEIDGELVELMEPLPLHEELFGKSSEEIGLLYRGEEITTVGRVLKAWHEHYDSELDEEVRRRETDYRGDALMEGQLFFKHDGHKDIISFQLSWGSIVSQAMGYLNMENGEVSITDFFTSGQASGTNHAWSPCGKYHTYQVSYAGEGERELRLTSLEDLSNLEIEQPEKLLGDFKNLSWAEDSSSLSFDLPAGSDKTDEVKTGEDKATLPWIITLEDRVLKPQVAIIDETETAKWPLAEIIQLAEEAFHIYLGRGEFRQVPGILTDELEADLQRGVFSIMHYPGVGPAGPGAGYFVDDISLQLTKIIKEEERVKVEADLAYPHIESDKYQQFKEKITAEILTAKADGETVSPRDAFTAVLQEADIGRAETQKNLEITRIDDQLKVSYVDPPENIFSSFTELYKEAVAGQVEEVTVLTGGDEKKDTSVKAKFAGSLMEGDDRRFINHMLDPHYLLDKTTMVLPNGLKIPLENIWRPLAQKEYANHPGYGFEEFLPALRFIEEAAPNKIVAYADYGVPPGGEAHVVFGYVDLETKEFNLFRFSRAGGASRSDESVRARFLWSPQGDKLAYTWLDTGGTNHLEVYDTNADGVTKIIPEGLSERYKDADEIIIIPPEKLPEEYEVHRLHFADLKWSETGDTLNFNIREMEYADWAWKKVEGTEVVDYSVTF